MPKVKRLVLDAGPLLRQTESDMRQYAEELYTTPEVFAEIRGAGSRQNLDLWKDRLYVQTPTTEAVRYVRAFATATGDILSLSNPDISVLALAYDLHEKLDLNPIPSSLDPHMHVVEYFGGKRNGSKCADRRIDEVVTDKDGFVVVGRNGAPKVQRRRAWKTVQPDPEAKLVEISIDRESEAPDVERRLDPVEESTRMREPPTESESSRQSESDAKSGPAQSEPTKNNSTAQSQSFTEDEIDDDWGDDGWITPANLKDAALMHNTAEIEKHISSGVASEDFSVQNVTLRMGIDLITPSGLRVKGIRSKMHRCHACFTLVPPDKNGQVRQFCPRCGGHTLQRVSVEVRNGELRVYLSSKRRWHTSGDRYTIANPQSRRARRSQRPEIEFYAEDQPEYVKAVKSYERQRRLDEKRAEEWVGPNTFEVGFSPFMEKHGAPPPIKINQRRPRARR